MLQHEPGELVVLAETEAAAGPARPLPHHCTQIPDEVRAEYAADIAAALAKHERLIAAKSRG
jgi:hypothetical protein